ncbi:MAG: Rhomboid family protein [Acidimicrobiales bacterium]|nr:Rhomboid family protein [Acidimicrobiales bacterium]
MSDERNDAEAADLPEWLRPFVIVVMLVAVMWAVEILDLLPHTNFDRWGIRPRTIAGLLGIVTAPFLHAGFAHLIGNTVPFLVLGGIIATGGVARYLQVTAVVALVSGGGTWLVGPNHSDHIGASGVVFGYLTYLLARGFFERKVTYLLVGAVVLFVYGGILWGLFPHVGISWQGHIFGAAGGVVAARMVHGAGRAEPTRDDEPAAA